jgi:adenylate cyclase
MWHDDYGWKLPALPLVVGDYVQMNSFPLPQNMLINWRGKPFSYHYVTFSDVFTDLSSKVKKRPQNEFTGKTVIIGSTAAGLFDIKATAMNKQFPGVEILATAIDNVKHRDYLRVWRGKTPYILMSLFLIWGTTLAYYLNLDRAKFNSIFTSSQLILLVISYIAINLTNTYLDLTAPILWAIALFGIAKMYALANDRALQRWLAFGIKSDTAETGVLIMPILIESTEPLSDALLKKLKRSIELASQSPNNIEILQGTQSGIWGLFGDMLVANWHFATDKAEYAANAKQDADKIGNQLPTLVNALGLPINTSVRYTLHEGKLMNQENTLASAIASQWRTLFAQAVIKLEHNDDNIEVAKRDLA